jgi:hypothetical protein
MHAQHDTKTIDTTAPAWAWVLEHAAMIRATAQRHAQGTGLDTDDLHSQLLLRLVDRWHRYDSDRSAPVTWVWWQARAARKDAIKLRRRDLQHGALEDWHHPAQAPAAEAVVELAQVRAMATEQEWQAASLLAQGVDGADLGAACGCAPFSARRRVARLRARYLTA